MVGKNDGGWAPYHCESPKSPCLPSKPGLWELPPSTLGSQETGMALGLQELPTKPTQPDPRLFSVLPLSFASPSAMTAAAQRVRCGFRVRWGRQQCAAGNQTLVGGGGVSRTCPARVL